LNTLTGTIRFSLKFHRNVPKSTKGEIKKQPGA
jgi:hypothetical protein